jgi:hypothetical protein
VLLGLSATGAAQVWLGLGQTVWIWAAAGFCFVALIPILNGANQAIWQAKVAPGVQGRVFAARRMIAQIIGPVGMALAGPLADRLFEPAMHPGGSLAALLGAWFGTGPGAGMAVIMAGPRRRRGYRIGVGGLSRARRTPGRYAPARPRRRGPAVSRVNGHGFGPFYAHFVVVSQQYSVAYP